MISVIIMTYKNFNNIEKNIESIASQTEINYEVILSDDGSPNFNELYIKNIFNKFKIEKFKIIKHEKNIGTVKNYESAIEMARGKYIVPLSQDDVFFSKSVLMMIKKEFEDCDADFVYTKRIGEISKNILPNVYDWKMVSTGNTNNILKRLMLSNCISGACLSIKKDSLIEIGGFDNNFYLLEDYPLIMKAVLQHKKISFLNIIAIKYGERGISNNKQLSSVLITDYISLSKKYLLNNISVFNTKIAKDYILRRFEVYKNYNKRLYIVFLAIKYIRLSLLNLKIKILKEPKDKIFEYLLINEIE